MEQVEADLQGPQGSHTDPIPNLPRMTAADGPTITVVVPAYNEERYIAEALDAVFAQTLAPLEVIVVDDGSTDCTVEIVRRFGDRVRLLQQENRGCPGAFDTGFREAEGDFVALCPADDIWEPRKLEWQREALAQHPEVDVVFGAAERFGLATGDHARPARDGMLDGAWFAQAMYPRNLIADPSAVVRRSLYLELGGYEPLVGEDYEFWMRALAAGATFYFEPRLVVRLREHGGNLSYRALDIWETNHLIHERYAELARDPELVRRTLAHDLLMIGYCRAALGRSGDARRSFRASLEKRLSPFSLAAAIAMSVPGVAKAVSRAAPRIRRASAGITG
jgi:glycosyltransferase involved in cell wall biosynthesis